MRGMRVGCSTCSRVLPFLHESLRGADARAAVRCAALKNPWPRTKPFCQPRASAHGQTDSYQQHGEALKCWPGQQD